MNDTTDLLRNISRDIGRELAPQFSLHGCADLLSSVNSSSRAPTRQQGLDPTAAGPESALRDPELLQACLGAASRNASGFLGAGLAGNSSGNSSLPWSGIVLDLLQGFISANGCVSRPFHTVLHLEVCLLRFHTAFEHVSLCLLSRLVIEPPAWGHVVFGVLLRRTHETQRPIC